MEYKVVEVKWSREGQFFGTPPMHADQAAITDVLNDYRRRGWDLVDIQHEIGDNLRFSIITLSKGSDSAVVAPAAQPVVTDKLPRTGGAYLARGDDESRLIRFYEDGRVITATTDAGATGERIADWFSWENEAVARGEFTLEGTVVAFDSVNAERTVQYRGTFQSAVELNVTAVSLSNGQENRGSYAFVRVAAWK